MIYPIAAAAAAAVLVPAVLSVVCQESVVVPSRLRRGDSSKGACWLAAASKGGERRGVVGVGGCEGKGRGSWRICLVAGRCGLPCGRRRSERGGRRRRRSMRSGGRIEIARESLEAQGWAASSSSSLGQPPNENSPPTLETPEITTMPFPRGARAPPTSPARGLDRVLAQRHHSEKGQSSRFLFNIYLSTRHAPSACRIHFRVVVVIALVAPSSSALLCLRLDRRTCRRPPRSGPWSLKLHEQDNEGRRTQHDPSTSVYDRLE